jgi:alpha-ketoglutarate-dependent taurine dioxygenase
MVQIRLPSRDCPHASVESDVARSLSEIDVGDLIALYQTHGAILLRGFHYSLGEFGDFCRSICPTAVMNDSPGRAMLDSANGIQSVNLGEEASELHPELSREPWKPDTAFFACVSPPRSGGETTICDGVALVRALPKPVFDGLIDRRLVHIMPTWPGLLEFWLGDAQPSDDMLARLPENCPYRFHRQRDGRILRSFSRPALHRPMFTDEPAFGNFLLFARYQNGRPDFPLLDDFTVVSDDWMQQIKACGDALTYAVQWQAGDVLILDNTRFMHGRRPIVDPDDRMIATYFGYLACAVPNPEEPPNPLWRQGDFCAPDDPRLVNPR